MGELDQALRIERLESDMRHLGEQVKQGLDDLKLDVRRVNESVSGLRSLQQSHDTHDASISEIKETLGDMNRRLEEWFDDHDDRQRKQWREHDKEHEQVDERISSVRDKIIWASGVCVVGGALVFGFLWVVNDKYTDLRISADSATQRIDDDREKIHEIELYLARGGGVPAQPYITEQQKGKRK